MEFKLKCCYIAAEGEQLKRWTNLDLALFLSKSLNLCSDVYIGIWAQSLFECDFRI